MQNEQPVSSSNEGEEKSNSDSATGQTFSERLNKLMSKSSAETRCEQSIARAPEKALGNAEKFKQLAHDVSAFESTNIRKKSIAGLHNGLRSVPPTSVESERAFSAAGLFVTKIRSSLSNRSIKALCMVRAYHMNN